MSLQMIQPETPQESRHTQMRYPKAGLDLGKLSVVLSDNQMRGTPSSMEARIAPVTLATDTEGVAKTASIGVRSATYFPHLLA